MSDLRLAFRTLAKSPAFTITAIAALALGIGANTAIFSVVNQILLNPAGVSKPERIVALHVKYDKLGLNTGVSVPDAADVQKSTQLFESAALLGENDFSYTGGAVPERLQGAAVSMQWFDVFGAKPRLGRTFQPEEDKPDANQVAVLSYAAWKRSFGQDSAILGRIINLNQKPYRVVGVMGPDFRWPAKVDLWVPLGLPAKIFSEDNRFNESYEKMARLKPGVSFEQANAFVRVLSDRVKSNGSEGGAYAKASAWGMFLVPFTDFVAGDTKTPMLILLGAVVFVLLIACSNIAGLMLARASGRAKEIAVRAALGAGQWHLIRQSMAESLVLASSGALAGLALAYLGIRALLLLTPENAPVALDVRIDGPVLWFTAATANAAGILFGIAPAWQITRIGRYDSLKEGGRSGTAGVGRQRLRAALVIGEVALALMLLVGAGLFLRSLARLQDVSPGFEPRGVMTTTVSLPDAQYHDPDKRIAFYRAVLERLSNIAGVTTAAAGIPVPFSGSASAASFRIEGRPRPPGDPGPHGDIRYVSPTFFSALRIPLKTGRAFTDQDRRGGQPVVVIDETLAKQYWPDEDPIGKHMRNDSSGPWHTIVGVVGHVKGSDLAGDTGKGTYYYSMFQRPLPFTTFLVRTESDPARLAVPMRQAVQAIDPAQPVSNVKTLSDMVASSLAPRRFIVTLLGFFAAVALLMAVLGLYGVISYSVTQRTQELGIRMALGAQRRQVLSLVIGQGMRLAVMGALIGLLASLGASRLLRNQLFQVSAFDPVTFIAMAALLIGAALLASYVPARRATRVDPMDALRYE